MADEEFEDVRGTKHVCRGFEGGLRKAVKVDDDREYQIGDRVVFVVEAEVGKVLFEPHEDDEDPDEDGEGLDRCHISGLVTVTVVERETVAEALDDQRRRNETALAERERLKAERRERRKAERKAERERAKAAGERPLFDADGGDEDDDDLTPAESNLRQLVGQP